MIAMSTPRYFRTVQQLKDIIDKDRFHVMYVMIQEVQPDLSEYKTKLLPVINNLPIAAGIVAAHDALYHDMNMPSSHFYDRTALTRINELTTAYKYDPESCTTHADTFIKNSDFTKIYQLIDTTIAILREQQRT